MNSSHENMWTGFVEGLVNWSNYLVLLFFAIIILYSSIKGLWHKNSDPSVSDGQKKTMVQERALWLLLASAFVASSLHLESKLQRIDDSMHSINSHLSQVDSERLETARSRLDSGFNLIFGDRLDSAINHLKTAVNNKEILLGYEDFKSLYLETLAKLPEHTFCAISVPTKNFFWGDPVVKEAVAKFMTSGGHMRRIFLLDQPLEKDSEQYEIMNNQHLLGIEVYYAMRSDIPPEKQNLFLVDSELIFSWTLDVDSLGRIAKATGTSDLERSRKLLENWNYVRQHYAKEFTPDAPK